MDSHGQSHLSHGTVGFHRILMANLDIPLSMMHFVNLDIQFCLCKHDVNNSNTAAKEVFVKSIF